MTLRPEVFDEYDRRCTEARRAAGLPDHIEDPVVLDQIARIVLAHRAEQEAKKPART